LSGLLMPNRKIDVLVTHPKLKNGVNFARFGVIGWGHSEDWKNYTSVYIWHEILHSYFDKSDLNHTLIELIADNELRYRHPGGKDFDYYAAFCSGADVLVHDAEFTEADYERTRTWGHSTFTQALELALESKVKRFGLFHHNQDRSDSEIDAMVGECEKISARKSLSLDCFGVAQESIIEL